MWFARAFFILYGGVDDGVIDFEVLRIFGRRIERRHRGIAMGEKSKGRMRRE